MGTVCNFTSTFNFLNKFNECIHLVLSDLLRSTSKRELHVKNHFEQHNKQHQKMRNQNRGTKNTNNRLTFQSVNNAEAQLYSKKESAI